MFLQAFIAFIFGSIVINVAKWQANKLVGWYLTRHFRNNPPQIIGEGSMVAAELCTCDCGAKHPQFHKCTGCGLEHVEHKS